MSCSSAQPTASYDCGCVETRTACGGSALTPGWVGSRAAATSAAASVCPTAAGARTRWLASPAAALPHTATRCASPTCSTLAGTRRSLPQLQVCVGLAGLPAAALQCMQPLEVDTWSWLACSSTRLLVCCLAAAPGCAPGWGAPGGGLPCVVCPPGMYSTGGASPCIPCVAGRITTLPGQSSCGEQCQGQRLAPGACWGEWVNHWVAA